MSQSELRAILDQLITDTAFRERIDIDPEGTIGNHDLTSEEQDALLSWDVERIEAALGGPLTDDQRAVVAEMGPSILQSGGSTPPPVYDAPLQTPGGRLSADGYRAHRPRET
jgi:hypothetical protein